MTSLPRDARVVAIDAATVFVATEDRVGAFRRAGLPPEWRQQLRSVPVNARVAELLQAAGVPAETPFSAVPALCWPAESTRH